MQAGAFLYHVSQQLICFGSFRGIEACQGFAVFFLQHAAAVGFDDSLLSPVIGIFLHEEAHVAGVVFNLFRSRFNFVPGFGRVSGVKPCCFKNFRVVVQYRHTDGVRHANLFAVVGLRQRQYVRQEVVF